MAPVEYVGPTLLRVRVPFVSSNVRVVDEGGVGRERSEVEESVGVKVSVTTNGVDYTADDEIIFNYLRESNQGEGGPGAVLTLAMHDYEITSVYPT